MSTPPAEPAGDPAVLDESSEHQLAWLRRALARQVGFGLFLVVADGAARRETLRRLAVWGKLGQVPPLTFVAAGPRGAEALEGFLQVPGAVPGGLVVSDAGSLADGHALEALNAARDVLPERLGGPLVLVVDEATAAELPHRAGDLYDVRVGTCTVRGAETAEAWSLRAPVFLHDAAVVAELAARARALRRAATADEAPPRSALADEWLALGEEQIASGKPAAALVSADEACRHAEAAGYGAGAAHARLVRGRAQEVLGELAAAWDATQEALAGFEVLAHLSGITAACGLLARLAARRGDLQEAETYARRSVAVAQRDGERAHEAPARVLLAEILHGLGRREEAETEAAEALRLAQARGSGIGEAEALLASGRLAWRRGDDDSARALAERAGKLLEVLANDVGAGFGVLVQQGDLCALRGDLAARAQAWAEAAQWGETLREVAVAIGDRSAVLRATLRTGVAHLRAGRPDAATHWLDQALRLAENLGDSRSWQAAIGALATVAVDRRDADWLATLASRTQTLGAHWDAIALIARARYWAGLAAELRGDDPSQAFTEALQHATHAGERQLAADAASQLARHAARTGAVEHALGLALRAFAEHVALGVPAVADDLETLNQLRQSMPADQFQGALSERLGEESAKWVLQQLNELGPLEA